MGNSQCHFPNHRKEDAVHPRARFTNQNGISTTQKPAPREKSRFDVLSCEQSEERKKKISCKIQIPVRPSRTIDTSCGKHYIQVPSLPNSGKGEANTNPCTGESRKRKRKLLLEGHIQRLDKCTSDCFIAPIVITVKKDESMKLALDAKSINRQLYKNKYQIPNVDELLDGVSQIVTAQAAVTLIFTVLDLKYAYSQLKLTPETARQ